MGFFCVTLGLPVRGGQFKQVLCDGLWVDFDVVFSTFSQSIAFSDALHISHFRR